MRILIRKKRRTKPRYGLIILITILLVLGMFVGLEFTKKILRQPILYEPKIELILPTQGTITQGFRRYKHEGIDIANAAGTLVVAAAKGKIIQSGWDDWGLGNSITIEHPNGLKTIYGHNRKLLVQEGQKVKQGQAIAELGSTGNSSGSHLHFEVLDKSGVAFDPMLCLTYGDCSPTQNFGAR